eukprot:g2898.t1
MSEKRKATNDSENQVETVKKSKTLDENKTLCVGVLALQGAFREHIACLHGSLEDSSGVRKQKSSSNGTNGNAFAPLSSSSYSSASKVTTSDGIYIDWFSEGGATTNVGEKQQQHLDLNTDSSPRVELTVKEIRTMDEIDGCDGIIIPGGESTAMAVINAIGTKGIFKKLSNYVQDGNPTWGTCAGMILLANRALGVKDGGQKLIGGLDVTVHRNFFGSQRRSFEAPIQAPPHSSSSSSSSSIIEEPFNGVFIRAPAIVEYHAETVQVLSTLETNEGSQELINPERPTAQQNDAVVSKEMNSDDIISSEGKGDVESSTNDTTTGETGVRHVPVAVQQNQILATAFHPELCEDDVRWHRYFLSMVYRKKYSSR